MVYKLYLFLGISFWTALGLDNGIGLTPPMGFNTWNHFACDINETVMIEAADAIVKLGLRDLGYIYINIDDCWMTSKRSAEGELVPDPIRFPRGIKFLADYVHQLGLKLGIYSSAGKMTCQRLPASLDNEDIDARTWAKWGIDYLKYDNCFRDMREAKIRYTRMRDALNKTGRHIFYSICNWGEERLYEIGKTLGNSWRTTYDIENTFESMRSIFRQNSLLAEYSTNGGWNDPDMLEVGNGVLTHNESKTHFTLWAMAKSPLLIGCDLSKISSGDFEILSNREVIAINQDLEGKQAICALNCNNADFSGSSNRAQFFVGKLSRGAYVLSVTNWNNQKTFENVNVSFRTLRLPLSIYKVRDIWNKKELGIIVDAFTIRAIAHHETFAYKLEIP